MQATAASLNVSKTVQIKRQLSTSQSRLTSLREAPLRNNKFATKCTLEKDGSENVASVVIEKNRRDFLTQSGLIALASTCSLATASPTYAVGFQKELKKKKVPLSDYTALPDFEWKGEPHKGIKIYDNEIGNGKELVKGATVVVHYDCKYRGLLALSSREARLLGGNRTIAEPFELTYGRVPSDYLRTARFDTFTGVGIKVSRDDDLGGYFVDNVTKNTPGSKAGITRNDSIIAINGEEIALKTTSQVSKLLIGDEGTDVTLTIIPYGETQEKELTLTRAQYKVKAKQQVIPVEGGGGLFAGSSGPKPPAALFLALDGMRVGGKRSIVVPADIGYGDEGNNEIPPDADFFIMDVEILDMRSNA